MKGNAPERSALLPSAAQHRLAIQQQTFAVAHSLYGSRTAWDLKERLWPRGSPGSLSGRPSGLSPLEAAGQLRPFPSRLAPVNGRLALSAGGRPQFLAIWEPQRAALVSSRWSSRDPRGSRGETMPPLAQPQQSHLVVSAVMYLFQGQPCSLRSHTGARVPGGTAHGAIWTPATSDVHMTLTHQTESGLAGKVGVEGIQRFPGLRKTLSQELVHRPSV